MVLIPLALDIAVYAFIVWALVHFDRGAKEPKGIIALIAGLLIPSMVVVIIAEAIFAPQTSFPGYSFPQVFIAVLPVGIIEETAKCLPVALLMWKKPYFRDYSDGIIYFGIAGATFAVIETGLYMLGLSVAGGIFRLVLDGVFHMTTCAFIGYFVARKKVTGKSAGAIIVAYLAAVCYHTMYDSLLFGAASTSANSTAELYQALALVMAFATYGIVAFLIHHSRHEDLRIGLAWKTRGYCGACNHPNPKHYLFCTVCGARTV